MLLPVISADESFTAGWDAGEVAHALAVLAHRDAVVLTAVRRMSVTEISRRSGISRDTITRIISRSPHSRPGRS